MLTRDLPHEKDPACHQRLAVCRRRNVCHRQHGTVCQTAVNLQEPEQFPGLVYRLEEPKVVVLLFGSGKLIITGGKEPEDAKKAVLKIVDDLKGLGLL